MLGALRRAALSSRACRSLCSGAEWQADAAAAGLSQARWHGTTSTAAVLSLCNRFESYAASSVSRHLHTTCPAPAEVVAVEQTGSSAGLAGSSQDTAQHSSGSSTTSTSHRRPPRAPWTPTRDLSKRKTLPKRMGHLMQVLEGEMAVAAAAQKNLPDFGPGDVVQLKLAVPENKRRVSFMKGLCIARFNRGWRTSFTLRNFITGGGGLERTFPLYSPTIQEITVLKRQRTRRAKLYYLRDRQPREYRVL